MAYGHPTRLTVGHATRLAYGHPTRSHLSVAFMSIAVSNLMRYT
ncbi:MULTISPECIES: hypothetical protein [unclassified Moorena]|nr:MULTISPECIES: hypothetical protein [unclassified Moorena]